MAKTPDRHFGPAFHSTTQYELQPTDPTVLGEVAFVDQGGGQGDFRMKDRLGVFNPRDGGTGNLPTPVNIGQVLFAKSATEFTVEQPLTTAQGWLVNEEGTLLIVA